MVFTFPENALNLGVFNQAPCPVKTLPQFLIVTPTRQKEITRSPSGAFFFGNLFLPTTKGVDETMKYMNTKMTCNIRLFIFCMICNFSNVMVLKFCK